MTTQPKARGGRPKTTGKGTLIGIRLQKPDLKALDDYCERKGVTRPEAIRRFIRAILQADRDQAKTDPTAPQNGGMDVGTAFQVTKNTQSLPEKS